MIDLHCHLACGVDDGPKIASDSLSLAKALYDAGVTTVACTSHLRRDKGWVNDSHVQHKIHTNLNQILDEKDVPLKRVKGAEHYLDELLANTCRAAQTVPYADTKWLLVELPYHVAPPNLLGKLYEIRKLGYRILLAHIERFPYVVDRPDMLDAIVHAGYGLQVNLGSLAGAYNKAIKKAADRIVCEGLAAVCAGDCHRADQVDEFIIQGRRALRKLVGEEGEDILLVKNPMKILENRSQEEFLLS